MSTTYTPLNWYWIVGGDETRFWSSAANGYVESTPEGSGVTRIPSEEDLTDVLAAYGLPGPIVKPPDLQPYQFRAMLKISGKESDLLAFMAALPDPARSIAEAKLEYTLSFRRDNDLVESARQALGLSVEELDALWSQAAAIQ